MGNCLRHRSSMTWAGDDWDSLIEPRNGSNRKGGKMEVKKLMGEKEEDIPTEVKIKLTKKQVDELLGRVDFYGMSMQEVAAHLMKMGGEAQLSHRPWRPALQSIPEVN